MAESIDLRAASDQWALHRVDTFPLHHPLTTSSEATCSCLKLDCGNVGKHPRLTDWQGHATIDLDVIAEWRRKVPEHNIGIPTGRAFDVLDIDGSNAMKLLDDIATGLGQQFRDGPVARTGNGWHYLFAPTGYGNFVGLWPGVDWRGVGGYVVGAPSLHASGRRYEWVVAPWERPPPPAPRFVLDQLAARDERSTGPLDDLERHLYDSANPTARLLLALEAPWKPTRLLEVVRRAAKPAGVGKHRKPGNRNAALYWASMRACEAWAFRRIEAAELDVFLADLEAVAVERGLTPRAAHATTTSARRRVAQKLNQIQNRDTP